MKVHFPVRVRCLFPWINVKNNLTIAHAPHVFKISETVIIISHNPFISMLK